MYKSPWLLRWCLLTIGLPFLLVLWLLVLVVVTLFLPFQLLITYFKPARLKPPGERNLQGMHYNFSPFCDLSPELHLRCIDDWTVLLYGADKLPQHSIRNYFDAEHLMRREILESRDLGVREHLQQQINHAREELSRTLGHYC